MSNKIYFKGGYKYQLTRNYLVQTSVRPNKVIDTPYIRLSFDGMLWLRAGYAWDGPSGPTFDTPNFMRGSLVHDAFYQLMREGFLNRDKWRKTADQELRRICREDGMCWIRAKWVYDAVRCGGRLSSITAHSECCAP